MKTSISIGAYGRRNIKDVLEFVIEAERAGVDHVWSAEAWGTDAVTSLAWSVSSLAPELCRSVRVFHR